MVRNGAVGCLWCRWFAPWCQRNRWSARVRRENGRLIIRRSWVRAPPAPPPGKQEYAVLHSARTGEHPHPLTGARTLAIGDLSDLVVDWCRHLRARNLSPKTITSYRQTGEAFRGYLASRGMPTDAQHVTREHIETWLAELLADGRAVATVARHYRNLQQLWRWLVDDGEIPHSPMERMRPPAVPEQQVPLIPESDLAALLATCKGNMFENRRDTAILRLLIDTGMRLSELTGPVREQDRGRPAALPARPGPAPDGAAVAGPVVAGQEGTDDRLRHRPAARPAR